VVGFYADPAMWESFIAQWEAQYGKKLLVGRRDHPIEWWMTGGRQQQVAQAIAQFHSAVVEGDMTHDGGSELTRHVLNARRRVRGNTVQIGKEHPDSINKIDAAVAAVLAWQARLDALAKGGGGKPKTNKAVFF
jgi:phage terminase large subunit-like protein